MKILLRLPNWIGDAVMATPTLELLKQKFPQASFTIIGTPAVCELFSRDKCITSAFIDQTKKNKNRILATYQFAKMIGKHDIGITFTNNIFSALLLFWSQTPIRIGYSKNLRSLFLTCKLIPLKQIHQVLLYACLLEPVLKLGKSEIIKQTPKLHLIASNNHYHKIKTKIGINPGGAFGSAKRWLKEYFAETILYFIQKDYEIVLFGNQSDIDSAKDIITTIEKLSLNKQLLQNITNLTGLTTIPTLIDTISKLDLFITNDSGPMHIATALQIPLIAIFGPTNDQETSPWCHSQAVILNKKLACSPCKKRVCPLVHHNCMKLITPDEVIIEANKILKRNNNDC
ncbi:lipopolysaccharide heptosyltransferase II [Helicobacter sp. 11S03491-1]|uniref:lipopolysaccharide heptosyltransferase II n=1 Tax=Helicobacter sp. 11S03491-1 TaxID=1476196 RepID=UPI000BA58BF2|nr:lipopolysaccharide heptosyltransferase II [Helicobacter sp. 11S03491-1]PAF41329.1 lipopolysaccharide heptosyltransferase II [Helicobacter sp. 11S03491-1]